MLYTLLMVRKTQQTNNKEAKQMKDYSTKAAAKKGAKRANLDVETLDFQLNDKGRWYWKEATNNELTQADLDFLENERKLQGEQEQKGPSNDGPFVEVLLTNDGAKLADKQRYQESTESVEKFTKATKGLKIQKDRPEQNGIVRPSAGGKCAEVWDACDALISSGVSPMPKKMKELCEQNGWNINNALIEMYKWRRFHGILGRQK